MPVKRHRASDYLKTQEDIVAYLNAAVEEMGDDPRLLMKAFRNVADARGGRIGTCSSVQNGSSSAFPRTVRTTSSATRYPHQGVCGLWRPTPILGVETHLTVTPSAATSGGAPTSATACSMPHRPECRGDQWLTNA